MSEYTPTTEELRAAWLANQSTERTVRVGPVLDGFDRWLAEVESAAAEKALGSFAEHLLTSTMPEYGPGINVTPYRDGLIDGVNRAVIAASRFYRSEGE